MTTILTLPDLIRAGLDGRSFADLSKDCGGTPSTAAISARVRSEAFPNSMDPPSLKALAKSLHVTERSIWLSSGKSLGLAVGEEESLLAALIVPGLGRLRQERVDIIRRFLILQVEDQDRDDELARLATQVAGLEKEAATLRKGAKAATRRR